MLFAWNNVRIYCVEWLDCLILRGNLKIIRTVSLPYCARSTVISLLVSERLYHNQQLLVADKQLPAKAQKLMNFTFNAKPVIGLGICLAKSCLTQSSWDHLSRVKTRL